jgi:hypothetical protein
MTKITAGGEFRPALRIWIRFIPYAPWMSMFLSGDFINYVFERKSVFFC